MASNPTERGCLVQQHYRATLPTLQNELNTWNLEGRHKSLEIIISPPIYRRETAHSVSRAYLRTATSGPL